MPRLSQFMLLTFLVIVAGCGQTKPAAVTEKADSAVKPVVVQNEPLAVESQEPAVQNELVATADEGTAEATFQQTLVAFQEGRLDAAFDFLPATYQADVQGVVHDFATKMDAEVWSKCFELLTKIANILKSKKQLILSLDNVKNAPQIESIKPHWDTFTAGLHDLATGDVANVSNLKHSNVRELLVSGSRLLTGMPLPKFGDVTVTTVNSDANTATLSYRDSKQGEPKQVEFVKIEGKWLPNSIASGWSAGIADAKGRLADLPGWISTSKPALMQQLDEVGRMLDQLQQAKTANDFGAAIVPLIMTMKFGTLWAEQAMQDAATAQRKGNAIHVSINRELSDDQQTKLRDAIVAVLEDPNVEYEMVPTDGKTRCRFTPVPDHDAFVGLIKKHFDPASVKWNPETKTILVELK